MEINGKITLEPLVTKKREKNEKRQDKKGSNEEKKFHTCEVCGERKATVQCQYCGAFLCSKCYGTWTVRRKCCGHEDEIFEETQREMARRQQK
jgi:transcription initiation factor IIE alpha subunit